MPPTKRNNAPRLRRGGSPSKPPPEVMTWGKAAPIFAVAIVFDAVRFMFQWFWIAGPALAAAYCTIKLGGTLGTTAAGFVCTTGAGIVGVAGVELLGPFGIVMAMATALAGWLVMGILLLWFNSRIFKENALWFGASLLLSEIPLVGSLPFFTGTLWKMYRTQIRVEKAAYKKWEQENAARLRQERDQQALEQSQFLQQQQADQQAALDNEWQDQMAQQDEQEASEQEQVAQEETVGGAGEIPMEMTPAPIQQQPIARSETKEWSPSGGVPPPLTPEYGYRKTPPPLPTPNYTGARPPPLPSLPVKYSNTSGMKERATTNSNERSVEQAILHNNVFIVHKIADNDQLRHNANSNVVAETTYEDDLDILLSLEPSISTTSVIPGQKTFLWSGASGVLIGGGRIGVTGTSDISTHGTGIKGRSDGGEESPTEEMHKIVGRKGKFVQEDYERTGSHGMNEIVVNDAEAFGFFQYVERDNDGRFWSSNLDMKKVSENKDRTELLERNVAKYRKRFEIAQERGLPLYVMTSNMEVYECLGTNDDGTVEVGKQLTPEEVAMGRAGLSVEKRIEIGERILKKKIFRKEETQKEAEEIIKSLQ